MAVESSRKVLVVDPDASARREILISDAAYAAARLGLGRLEQRQLELKGKSKQVNLRVLAIGSSPTRP